jgi:hypothetical protein
MPNTGIIVKYLGLEIKQKPMGTFLHQNNYTIYIFKSFIMEDFNPTHIPTERSKTSTRHKKLEVDPIHY